MTLDELADEEDEASGRADDIGTTSFSVQVFGSTVG